MISIHGRHPIAVGRDDREEQGTGYSARFEPRADFNAASALTDQLSSPVPRRECSSSAGRHSRHPRSHPTSRDRPTPSTHTPSLLPHSRASPISLTARALPGTARRRVRTGLRADRRASSRDDRQPSAIAEMRAPRSRRRAARRTAHAPRIRRLGHWRRPPSRVVSASVYQRSSGRC